MRISFIKILNFRKLKDVRIDFSEKTTLFVGANNSGKTSAMDALRKFLIKGEKNHFIYNDLNVANRKTIIDIGDLWLSDNAERPDCFDMWTNIVPTMDVWLDVENHEFHYVAHIIPTLSWAGGELGVRLSYLPKDIGKLFDDYREAYQKARQTEKSFNEGNYQSKLFPRNLCNFIEKYFNKYFEIRAFILDPVKANEEQNTDLNNEYDGKNPFEGLIKIDMIDAQRGLADADSTNDVVSLSHQFRTYYDRHLDIEKATSPEDLETLKALENATNSFNSTLRTKFKDALAELELLGYPGIADPKISIESKIREKMAFEHDSAIQYTLSNDDNIRLPEKYNGLGYQNLISIVFRLMSFRDDRIHKGKAASDEESKSISPLHLVLLEEPEAHLHVQVQQVLIKKAYDVLTNSEVLSTNEFRTQLAISTHSSHITKEAEFNQIRYFERVPADDFNKIPTSRVVNLTNTFGKNDEQTEKFVQRYLQVTHCDLFFADAVIFVEGLSENVLVPYFIKNDYPKLDSCYITILPVGGRHSHRFKPLIEKLNIPALIITDLDSAEKPGRHKSKPPQRKANLITGNASIKEWGLPETNLDVLLDLKSDKKILSDGRVRIAYQTPITLTIDNATGEVLSATFEASLAYTNLKEIKELDENKIIKTLNDSLTKLSLEEFSEAVYTVIHNSSSGKISFALDLMYQLEKVAVPEYIGEGLAWLQGKLRCIENDSLVGGVTDE